MSNSSTILHATTNYGDPRSRGLGYIPQKATCPVPGCVWTGELTSNNTFPGHCNTQKWTCDSVGLSYDAAANLQVDEIGRLIGIDEMQEADL